MGALTRTLVALALLGLTTATMWSSSVRMADSPFLSVSTTVPNSGGMRVGFFIVCLLKRYLGLAWWDKANQNR